MRRIESTGLLTTLAYLALAGLLVLGLSGCASNDDSLGDKVEDAADEAGDTMEEAADEAGDAVEEATEEAGDAAEEVGEAAEDATDGHQH